MDKSRYDFPAHGHGKTAPWVDLVNSEEWDGFGRLTDHLNNPAWFRYFLRQWHFAKPSRENPPTARLQTLRAALRKSSQAFFYGQAVRSPQLRAINRALNVSGKQQVFQRQNGLQIEFVPERSGWKWLLAEIARSFVETVAQGEPARIKICRNDGCRWIFYDQTKGKTRCWCSSKSCGNRERVRRARVRAL
ncbi:MAG TPA: CGNR zinc finger domain-containing protein [Candidatus Bathyarchaeia archaeon]|nr:CGNR zinc finger domain-containing protein [Candidatus Bathyarchaeia archaeon]